MKKETLYEGALEKVGFSLRGIDFLMTSSFEMETYSTISPSQVHTRLQSINGGTVPINRKNDGINMGNGWNSDCHQDGTVNAYDNGSWHDMEVSSAPLKSHNFNDLRDELQSMYSTVKQATQLKHSCMASSHVHTTVRYGVVGENDYSREAVSTVKFDSVGVYNRIASFMVKYMPVMKWLSMTCYTGARGSVDKSNRYGESQKNPYDVMEKDQLFRWLERTLDSASFADRSYEYLYNMQRQSYMRIYRGDGFIHWENRMCDQTASHTHMALWIAINRALTLWAIDMTRKGFQLELSYNDYDTSYNEMCHHRQGYKYVNRSLIEQQGKELLGYLTKYLYIGGNMDAVKYIEKLIKNPIPEYLENNNLTEHFDPSIIEKAFNERNRGKDEELRIAYVRALESMVIPLADNLNDFHTNCAEYLGVEVKQVKSLYQMLNRENVDMRWLGNRLVCMD